MVSYRTSMQIVGDLLTATEDTEVSGFGIIDKQFTAGEEYKIGFAIWDGGQGETAGDHAVTDWGVLKID